MILTKLNEHNYFKLNELKIMKLLAFELERHGDVEPIVTRQETEECP